MGGIFPLLLLCLVCFACVHATHEGGQAEEPALPASEPAPERVGESLLTDGMVRGIVVACLLEEGGGGPGYRGFVLQGSIFADSRPGGVSEGIFVGTGTNRLVFSREGAFEPTVGDELILRGRPVDLRGRPALLDPFVLRLVRRDADLEREVPTFDAIPPDDAVEARRYWTAHQGMRCRLPAGCLVQGVHVGDGAFPSTLVTVIRPDTILAGRAEPFQRRVFRDAHPLDDQPDVRFDNENGARITLADGVLRERLGPAVATLPPLRTFDVITSCITGVVLRSGDRFAIYPEAPLTVERGVPPDQNGAPLAPRARTQLSVVTYNMENLYDFRDDPFDPNDFYEAPQDGATNAAARLQNYVPASSDDYARRVRGLAAQVVRDLEAPDLLLLQEIEDQDIGFMQDGMLQVSTVNNRDGRLDALQELTAEIVRLGGPLYAPVADRAGADERGIICAILFRTDRVRLASVALDHPVLGAEPRTTYAGPTLAYRYDRANPRAVNGLHPSFGLVHKRAVQVVCLERAAGSELALAQGQRLYAINGHFQSQPGNHVDQRIEQVRLTAAVASAVLAYEPEAWLVAGGDLNTFPRPDEAVPNAPADQLGALYDAGLVNLHERQLERHPASAYTYVYQGEAGTLDHLFVSSNLFASLVDVRPLHINADYGPDPLVSNRRCSDHDPVQAIFAAGE